MPAQNRHRQEGHGFALGQPFSRTKRAMIGHGRPASLAFALARAAVALCACLSASVRGQNAPAVEPMQLRITWGGGDATRWQGRIAVADGKLGDLKLLESNPDAVGSIWLEEGQVRVGSLS